MWCNFRLQVFTPHAIKFNMSVVKKDKVVYGMLQDELERCQGLSSSLVAGIAELPKGSLHVRKIPSGKKYLPYHYLKFRDGARSLYKHVPERLVQELASQIEERRKMEENLRQIRSRIKYLNKLLKTGRS